MTSRPKSHIASKFSLDFRPNPDLPPIAPRFYFSHDFTVAPEPRSPKCALTRARFLKLCERRTGVGCYSRVLNMLQLEKNRRFIFFYGRESKTYSDFLHQLKQRGHCSKSPEQIMHLEGLDLLSSPLSLMGLKPIHLYWVRVQALCTYC